MSNVDQPLPEPERIGNFTLYKPAAATTTAAIYCHGVYDTPIDPLPVTLRYYCPHGDTVTTSITEAYERGDPTDDPTVPGSGGKWGRYVLSKIALDSSADFLRQTANTQQWAIALVEDPTDTVTLVTELAGRGYIDIRGVHCREVIDQPIAPATYGEPFEVEHAALIGWHEYMNNSTITAGTDLEESVPLWNPASNKQYFIEEVLEKGKRYKIKEVSS